MSLQNTSHDPWIGKLAWFFPRDSKGLPIGHKALCGIVIDKSAPGVYVIIHKGNRVYSWVADMEEMEEWDEELEREDSSMEESSE